ncbi:heat shock protein [Yersinia phage vB_YenM_56.17]|uniref:Heat shock protein n=1 Tax=Yersinia phage vB_YenM_56.17 TaxID=2918927 RepID=A0AAE9JWP6_9CAUD|nr:hypothetical protein [Yersinia enterocolitica]YP_010664272.1 heat shock protein [Yersinia phage vB_YenM_56.17]MCE3065178.1 hypothetical protein [Yersinia enterocolitica]UNA05900.1 heat shock protein [Yersinia phage vB_YenM_56.17]HDL8065497.1 hypothetical protein [Yersinia enterocolitica]
MLTFHQRKKARTDYYLRFVHGWKLRECGACNGSGYYDNNGSPDCGACSGTGKARYKLPVAKNDLAVCSSIYTGVCE